ncbi:MAG: hypothetical protein LQ340_000842 [Diploschistes diacapsis]|nr:MAG: hypothetical protein LQ340_000842 [Diploschistes diacapsis]
MTENSNPGPANLGSLGVQTLLGTAPIINVVAEWASLIPLALHLTNRRQDYSLMGELALTGQMSVGLFEELGFAKGMARLLQEGSDFLDHASIRGNMSREVWDVNWGSTFPCSNGAACAIVTAYALRKVPEVVNISDRIHDEEAARSLEAGMAIATPLSESSASTSLEKRKIEALEITLHARHVRKSRIPSSGSHPEMPPSDNSALSNNRAARNPHRRYQRLHILDFQRATPDEHKMPKKTFSFLAHLDPFFSIFILGIAGLLVLFGLYGTALGILAGLISKAIVLCSVHLERPPGYLVNNEVSDACMLVATHRNATTWYLHTGDRGIVDHLLNKPMVELRYLRTIFIPWFRLGHIAQLTAMTFVAAQKGWDGVAMVVLMLCTRLVKWCYGGDYLARRWLAQEGITVRVKSFDFEGRTAMIIAIQALSESNVTRWMDDIIVPHPRRDALLVALGMSPSENPAPGPKPQLSAFDHHWVELHLKRVSAAATIMLQELAKMVED